MTSESLVTVVLCKFGGNYILNACGHGNFKMLVRYTRRDVR